MLYVYKSQSVVTIKKGAKKHKGINAARGIGPTVGCSFSYWGDGAAGGRSVEVVVAIVCTVDV